MATLIDCDPDNNREAHEIRKALNLKRQSIASIARVSKSLVDSWLVHRNSPYFRPMAGKSLRLLKLELGLEKPAYLHVRKEADKRSAAIKGA